MKNFNTIPLLILLAIFTYSCSSDDDVTPDKEVIDIVYQDIVPKAFLDLIKDECNGVVLQEGNNPPAGLKGKTFTLENILFCTNITSNTIGLNYSDRKFIITDFNPQTLECKVSAYDTTLGTQSESIIAYLLGDGNKFTIYSKEVSEHNDQTADFLNLLTGEYSAQGLTNVKFFLQSVRRDEGSSFLEPGLFRGLVEDLDNYENALVEFE